MYAHVPSREVLWDSYYTGARTTAAGRRALQQSQESLTDLSGRYGINSQTVAKWKKRMQVTDAPMGPKPPHSTVLTPEEETLLVAFRRHTVLPLDDCLYALQASLPDLTRSALHRCFTRHGISRLPGIEDDKPAKKQCNPSPIGYGHLDIAEVHTEEGTLSLFVAIDCSGKVAYTASGTRKPTRWAPPHAFAT